jgi:hypothetical protein
LFGHAHPFLSLPGLTGQSSNPWAIDVSETSPHQESGGYWIARASRAMTGLASPTTRRALHAPRNDAI